MPLCTILLISLPRTITIPAFLSLVQKAEITPLVQAKVVRWIILPSTLSTEPLLARNIHWDVLLVLPTTDPLPPHIQKQIAQRWSVTAGVPSALLKDWTSKNEALVNPKIGTVNPPSTPSQPIYSSSTQSLSLTPSLSTWISHLPSPTQTHSISMLNLLSFNTTPGSKKTYQKYGAEFARSIGRRHGGNAKIVGNVISGQGKEEGWDEIALAHYPSLLHFEAMLGSAEYQKANEMWRIGSLRDTCILCTMEVGVDGELRGGRPEGKEAKL